MMFGALHAFVVALSIHSVTASTSKYTRTSPPHDSIVVDASGKYTGSHATINAGVTALQTNTTAPQIIFILPGIYTEQVYIPPLQGPLTIQGSTPDARTYKHNTATLTFNLSRQSPGLANNDATATLRLWTPNVKIYNLNVFNTFGQAATNGQALALSAQKTNQAFYGCKFTGYQDTVYANEGRQIYAKSYISGAVDFIFGLRARAWFHDVDIESVGPGFITANGRDAANNTSIYVINESRISGTSGRNSTVLGRPWRQWSRVVVQRTFLGDVVKPEGWEKWDSVQSTENVVYREFGNFGPGRDRGQRVEWAGRGEREVRVGEVLGSGWEKEGWVDGGYL